MSDVELAWAAGFYDGEGSTMVLDRSRRSYLAMRVAQVDPRPLKRFQMAVGVGAISGPYERVKENHRASYNWGVAGKQAGPALIALWPYLSQPKREQILASFKRLRKLNDGFEDRRRKGVLGGRWAAS